MTTTLTIVEHGEWQRTVFAARDAIDIRITESCRYEILDWTDEGVNVERESCDTQVSAEGGGSTAYPAPAKNIAWTYHTRQPASPLSDVTLDSASGRGQMTWRNISIVSRPTEGSEGEGGLAPVALGVLMAASAGTVPEGAQFSSGQSVYDLQRFPFAPGGNAIARYAPTRDTIYMNSALPTLSCANRPNGIVEDTGIDGDMVPNDVEKVTPGCNPLLAWSCPTRPTSLQGTVFDTDITAYRAGWRWKPHEADKEDWAYPGHQCGGR